MGVFILFRGVLKAGGAVCVLFQGLWEGVLLI